MQTLPPGTPALLTVRQLRTLLGISRSFGYLLIRSGRLPAARIGKRAVLRVSRNELERFLRAHGLGGDR